MAGANILIGDGNLTNRLIQTVVVNGSEEVIKKDTRIEHGHFIRIPMGHGINRTRSVMNTKKIFLRIFLIIVCLSTFGNIVFSQPYYFYSKDDPDYKGGGYSVDIYRQNLANGISELILKDAGRIEQIFDSPDQNRLILQNRSQVVIVELNNSNKRTILFERDTWVVQVIFTPATNRYYVSIGSSEDEYQKTIVFDNTTFQPIDTLTELYSYEPICISSDQHRAYRSISDSNGLVFRAWDIFANKRLPDKNFTSLGTFAYDPGIDDAKAGLALIKYERIAESGFANQQYAVCNVEQGLVYTPFAFPWRSEGRLSAHGNYALIEQVNYDTTRETGEYRPGSVYVFDSRAGALLQRLRLPPEGKILLFDNYPNMLYYYFEKKQTSINLDLTKLPAIRAISPQNVLVGSGAFTLNVSGMNFTSQSKVQLNGTNRPTTFIADTLLQATVRAGDVDTATTAYIAVRDSIAPSSHVTTDSLALNIISVPQQSLQPILDCVTRVDDTTYTAWFGYENDDAASVYVPVGPQNKFSPTPNDRNQPAVFEPGRKDKMFSVTFNGKNLVWKLNGNEATASRKSPGCN